MRLQVECILSCFTCIRQSVTLWTIVHQVPLSMRFSRHEYWIGLHALLQRIFRYLITEDSCFLPPIPYNIIVILFTYPQAVITQLIFAIISLNRLLTVWSVNNKENILFYLHLSWSVFFVHHFINSSFHSLLACIASEEKSNMHFIFPTVLVSCFFFSWLLSRFSFCLWFSAGCM